MQIKLSYKIISPIILFLVGAVSFFVFFSVRSLETAMVQSAFFRTNDLVHSRFNQNISIESIQNPETAEAQGSFSVVLNEIADSSTVHANIWNTDGVIIFSDNDVLIGTKNSDPTLLAEALSSIDGFYRTAGSIRPWATSKGPIHMYVPVTIENERVVVEVEASGDVITKPVDEHIRRMITVMTTGGVVIILAMIFILRMFVLGPVEALRRAFRIFSQGNLSYKVKQGQSDELGELSRSVDSMRMNLDFSINALKRERDQSSAIVSSIGEGLIVIDTDYTVRIMNITAERLLDVNAKNYLGRKLQDLLEVYTQAEVLPVPEWAVTKAMNTKRFAVHNLDEKVSYKTPDGKTVGVIVVATPLLDGTRVIGAVLVFRDVTSEQQLDEAKDSFISIASHQLRTPLTSMRWFSEMLLNGDVGALTEQQAHFLKQVYDGTIRMIGLVNLLLQTARVEAGRLRVDPVPLSFDVLAAEVVATIQTSLDAKKQKVTIAKKPETLPVIPMDRDIVWQVFQNLLTNANRYSLVSGIIEVSFVVQKDDLVCSVRDHGIGIPKKDQGKIFQKFFRAPNALKSVPEGSGLGLSLVKTLVTQWGGKLWFETEEGKGTTFFFTVPLAGVKPKAGEVKIVV